MDPKQNPKPLDPKLQEAYDRVMGTSLTPDPLQSGTPTPVSDSATASPTVTPPVNTPTGSLTSSANAPEPFAIPTTTPPTLASSPIDPTQNPVSPVVPSPSDPFAVNPSASMTTPPVADPSAPITPINPPVDPLSPVEAVPPVDLSAPIQPISVNPVSPSDPSITVPVAATPVPSVSPTESLSATIPLAHSSETVSIGNLTGNTAKSARKKGISPMIILIGGIVFLVAYVLFWVKMFGLPIPFINQ